MTGASRSEGIEGTVPLSLVARVQLFACHQLVLIDIVRYLSMSTANGGLKRYRGDCQQRESFG